MEQKATVTLIHQTQDARKRILPQPLTSLKIEGELLPDSPLVHQMLAALLDKRNPPQVSVTFKNERNVITYAVTFSHTKNVVAEAQAEHELATEAVNRNIPIETLRDQKKQLADAQAKLKAEAAAPKA
jgi:hypothetical protein